MAKNPFLKRLGFSVEQEQGATALNAYKDKAFETYLTSTHNTTMAEARAKGEPVDQWRRNWERNTGTTLLGESTGVFEKGFAADQKARALQPPDLTDRLVREARTAQMLRLMAGRGRKSQFLTGPGGAPSPFTTGLLGG